MFLVFLLFSTEYRNGYEFLLVLRKLVWEMPAAETLSIPQNSRVWLRVRPTHKYLLE